MIDIDSTIRTADKIAYIVASESQIKMTQKALEKEIQEEIVDVLTVDAYAPREEYRRLCREGYGFIVARGGLYQDMQKLADTVPVMEEKILTSDIIEQMTRVREKYGREADRMLLILHEETAVGFENADALFDFSLQVKRYRTLEELSEVLQTLDDDPRLVMGNALTGRMLNRPDTLFVELKNRDMTMRNTVHIVHTLLTQMQDNIKKVNVIQSVFDHVEDGILIFDQQDRVVDINHRAQKFLGITSDQALGKNVRDIIACLPQKRTESICSEDSPRNFMASVGKIMISFSIYPFEFFKKETRYIITMQDVTKIQETERKIRLQLAKKGLKAEYTFDDIITENEKLKHQINKAKVIADQDGSVLIYGESGTGKELFAQSIHNASSRRNGPFVAVNCAALTESLLESELFGYVGGAFTGARKEGKVGLFEMAHKGTIFLDEINSMSLTLQSKILRVIEQKEVMRVGSDYVIPLDIRIISAANRNLMAYIREDKFRKDLFFRLNTFTIRIPPIRERKDDVLLLFRYYLAKEEGKELKEIRLQPEFEKQLLAHDWVGNVREIRSAVLRYRAFHGDNSNEDIIRTNAESTEIVNEDMHIDLPKLKDTVEGLVIDQLLAANMSKSDVAKTLGISRQALYNKLRKENQ